MRESFELIDQYLLRLRNALANLAPADREDIVAEIRGHILERSETDGDAGPATVAAVLERLGRPEDLAAQYRTEAMLARASHSMLPWVLLQATLRWAVLGVRGFLVFLTAIVGYVTGVAFFACAVAKPIFPENVGLWVGPSIGLNFGWKDQGREAVEVLGPWFEPTALTLGILLIWGTTLLIRWMLRRSGKLSVMKLARA